MYVYGPVPSRRLGQSLGVNLVPGKTCSYSCVYCQLGRTNALRIKRESFYPKEDILQEITDFPADCRPDYITLVGDGEPTLYRYLGWLIRQIKARLKTPVAVVTNGALLYRKDVRQDLEAADVVMPSVDAGDERLYNIINRPHQGIDFAAAIDGMAEFGCNYRGHLWTETMLIKGLNDTETELRKINKIVERISPERAYLLTPIRPPAEAWVLPPDSESLAVARHIINGSIPLAHNESDTFDLRGYRSAKQAILQIGRHHPMRCEQVREIERHFGESDTAKELLGDGTLRTITHNGEQYLLLRSRIAPRKKPEGR